MSIQYFEDHEDQIIKQDIPDKQPKPKETISASPFAAEEHVGKLVLTNTSLKVDIANIDQYENSQYARLRKNGLGASDSSIVLGVNPYTSREELIAEKARTRLTADEIAVGDKLAVRKGRDLEPLIIERFEKYLGADVIKPIDMYYLEDYPYIKINFDGVTGTPEQYIPCEIKVVTAAGERHYNRSKAWFTERKGFGEIPENISESNWSIETKAAFYGIPPYYYTQLQQQILGLNAPFGYLTVLFEKTWDIYSFYVWRDQNMLNNLIVEGYKVWNQVLERRGPGWQLGDGLDSISMAP